jgi:hypothetical protein
MVVRSVRWLMVCGAIGLGGLCLPLVVSGCGGGERGVSAAKTGEAAAVGGAGMLSDVHRAIPRAVSTRGLEAVPWKLVRLRGSKEVLIASDAGYCVGSEPPSLYAAASVREGHRVVAITVYVRRPVGGRICHGVGFQQAGTVRLVRALPRHVRVVDGGTTPPSIRLKR